jgi:hypothetical protein
MGKIAATILILSAFGWVSLETTRKQAMEYYVSPDGSDNNSGYPPAISLI